MSSLMPSVETESKVSCPDPIILPGKFLKKILIDVWCGKNEVGGEFMVTDQWTVSDVTLTAGGTNHVDYERGRDIQYHTHPLAAICKDGTPYAYAPPSMYDIVLLTMADAYTAHGGKIGFVFAPDAIYTIEVERLCFKGKSNEELHTYLQFAYYDLFNWVGAQKVAGNFIYDRLEGVEAYFAYIRSVHGVLVQRHSWPEFGKEFVLQTPCRETWLLKRGGFAAWSDSERRKVAATFSPNLGYLKTGWKRDERFRE
jgi:hypothetical protein